MQSHGEGSTLHSCFDSVKSAVMGCCYSICHKDAEPQEDIITESSRLLEASERRTETPLPAAAAAPPRKDEQSALNRILHETATNVIDVGALGPYALEPGAYSERVRAYTARVATTAPHTPGPRRLLADVGLAERGALLTSQPNHDVHLISNAVKRAAAAISELRVQHQEELVVPFRVPSQEMPSQEVPSQEMLQQEVP